MSFTLRKLQYRPWPVTVKLVESDESGVVSASDLMFVAHFKPLSEAEIKAVFEEEIGDQLGEQNAPPVDKSIVNVLEANSRIFARLLCGWSKVLDEAGSPVSFTLDALRALIVGTDGLAVSAGLQVALSEMRFGTVAAKNLLPSVAPGQSPEPVEATNSPAT